MSAGEPVVAADRPLITTTGLVEIMLLLLILVFGWLLRLEDLRPWQRIDDLTFHKGEPLLLGLDGYGYLDEARGLLENPQKFAAKPWYRQQPISILAASVTAKTGLSLRWTAALIGTVLGPLLVLPLYLLGRHFGGPFMGLPPALLGVAAPYYVQRSRLGWFDTDLLNVTLLLALAWCFIRFATVRERKGWGHPLAALFLFGLFLWWWQNAVIEITAVFLFFWGVAGYHAGLFKARAFWLYAGIPVLAILLFTLWRGEVFSQVFHLFADRLVFFLDVQGSAVPDEAVTINELNRPDFAKVVAATTGQLFFLLTALAGLFVFAWQRPRQAMLLTPVWMIALWGVAVAQRFLIFTGPVLALGNGFLVTVLWQRWGARYPRRLSAGLLLFVLGAAVSATLPNLNIVHIPKVATPSVIAGLETITGVTPANARIWTAWSYGYPLRYWARRAAVGPRAAVVWGEHEVYKGLPLASGNPRLAANFMRFYATFGFPGMARVQSALGGDRQRARKLVERIMAAGPHAAHPIVAGAGLQPVAWLTGVERWLAFFFPAGSEPLYLFLPTKEHVPGMWWYRLGTWDFDTGRGKEPGFFWVTDLHRQGAHLTAGDMELDVSTGIARSSHGPAPIQLRHLLLVQRGGVRHHRYERSESGVTGIHYQPLATGAILGPGLANSVYGRLFFFGRSPSRHFRRVTGGVLDHQLWRVWPDPSYR